MIKIGILGHFADKHDFYDGQTVKTRELYNELSKDSNFNVNKADTYYMKRSVISFIKNLFLLFKQNDKIIICLSWNGYSKILLILILFKQIFNCQLYDVVIGGNRHDRLAHSKFYKFLCKQFSRIYVESHYMVKQYVKLGLCQVTYMPNFKQLTVIKHNNDCDVNHLKVCTFSRICKEKGIEDAIDAVKEANRLIGYNQYSLTIFGNIEREYSLKFNEICRTLPEFIKYGGVVPYSETTTVLKDYFILLFPTFWDGEGFPGTIVDAFASGLPVIASDWNCNSEIIRNGIDGFIIPTHSSKILAEKLVFCAKNFLFVKQLSDNCFLRATNYLPSQAMKVLKKDLKYEKNNMFC